MLHPPDDLTGDLNEDSVVIKVTCGEMSVLLTGDATSDSEASMLAAGLAPRCAARAFSTAVLRLPAMAAGLTFNVVQ